MAEITGPQKRKDTFYALASAGHSLVRKMQRYTHYSIIEAKATDLTDRILSEDQIPVVDADVFSVDEVLPVLAQNAKSSVVLENVRPGYKMQTPVENALSDPKNGIKDIRFKDSEMEFTEYRSEPRYTSVEKMAFENVSMTGVVASYMPEGVLTELSFERCRMGAATSYNPDNPVYGTVCTNALAIAEKNPLKHLYLNEMSIMSGEPEKDSAAPDWSKLPVTLEYLSLSKTDVMNANFDGLTEALPKLKNLKALDISSCGLTDDHARKLEAVLSKTQIARVNLSGNNFSNEMQGRLLSLPDKQVAASGEYLWWDKAQTVRKIENDNPMAGYLKSVKNKDEMLAQDMFFPAAKGGSFKSVLDAVKACGEYLTAADYDLKDAGGETLLTSLEKTGQLPVVFDPQYWNDPKAMQAVWDKVLEDRRTQLGGDPKAAFQKRKNQVMLGVVRSALANKNRNR